MHRTNGAISIDGAPPFVPVSGNIDESGNIFAFGQGVVAGFSDILVEFSGALITEHMLSGLYGMGVGGGLPNEDPAIYQLEGQCQPANGNGSDS